MITSIVLSKLLQRWIHRVNKYNYDNHEQVHGDNIEHIELGKIYAIPSTPYLQDQPMLTEGKIIYNPPIDIDSSVRSNGSSPHKIDIEKKDIGDIVETIGCLVDTVIILYDVHFKHRHSAIARLMKGVQRQQRSKERLEQSKSNSGSDDDVDVDAYKEERTHTVRNEVKLIFLATSSKAKMELEAIQDVLLQENTVDRECIHIVSINDSNAEEEIMDYLRHEKENNEDDIGMADCPVMIDVYSKLLQNVHSRFSGKKGREKRKDVVLEFNTLKIIEKNEDIVQSESEELAIDKSDAMVEGNVSLDIYSKEEKSEFHENKKDVSDFEDHSPMTEYEINIDEMEDGINQMEGGVDTTLNDDGEVKDNFDFVSDSATYDAETESEVENNNEVGSTSKKSLEDTLAIKVHDIIQETEGLIRELEAKQNEVLMDIETKMPILSFGAEANRILMLSLQRFDDKDLMNSAENEKDKAAIIGEVIFL